MYNLVKTKSVSYLAIEAPSLIASTFIAELFYKFGSFSLELIAFLFTWYSLSRIISLFTSKKS
jgi:hypothetical protein